MAKSYTFFREDIIGLLLNHKMYIGKIAREMVAQGRDIRYITQEETKLWTEKFFDETIARGEMKLETILDEIDTVLKVTHGKTMEELADIARGKQERDYNGE